MKPDKEMSASKYSLMLVVVTFVLVEAKPEVPMTYTIDGGDSRPVTSHQNLTTCRGVSVELSVCVPTARTGSLLSLKVKGQTILSSKTCVRVIERFSSSESVVFSYDEEEFVFNVKVAACAVSKKRRSLAWRSRSSSMSRINDGSISWANSGQSTSRLIYAPPMSKSYMTCAKIHDRQPDVLSNGIRVLCDTVTEGGNWIVIQRRTSGDVDFYRNWDQYVSGFGDVTGDHWLGLENIHTLCPPSRPCILRVDLIDPYYLNGTLLWAEYSSFSLTGSSDDYRLSISGYDFRSTVGRDCLAYSNGRPFSTKDNDKSGDMASHWQGAWWYKATMAGMSELNGRYGRRAAGGILWYSKSYTKLYATYTEMKVRVF